MTFKTWTVYTEKKAVDNGTITAPSASAYIHVERLRPPALETP